MDRERKSLDEKSIEVGGAVVRDLKIECDFRLIRWEASLSANEVGGISKIGKGKVRGR